MKLFCTILLTLISFGAMAQSQYLKVAGEWEGTIVTPGDGLKVVFHIKYENEVLSATMDRPGQNIAGLKIDEISFTEGILKMKLNVANGRYEGTYKNNVVEGKWIQQENGFDLKLVKKVKRRTS